MERTQPISYTWMQKGLAKSKSQTMVNYPEFTHTDYLHFTSVRKGRGSMRNENFEVNGRMEPVMILYIKKQCDANANGIQFVPRSCGSIILGYRRGNLIQLNRYL